MGSDAIRIYATRANEIRPLESGLGNQEPTAYQRLESNVDCESGPGTRVRPFCSNRNNRLLQITVSRGAERKLG
jgi:hypothetical protein